MNSSRTIDTKCRNLDQTSFAIQDYMTVPVIFGHREARKIHSFKMKRCDKACKYFIVQVDLKHSIRYSPNILQMLWCNLNDQSGICRPKSRMITQLINPSGPISKTQIFNKKEIYTPYAKPVLVGA